MRLVAAQLRSIPGDIETNITRHVDAIHLAASQCADLILFPELSLTGYEPRRASALATYPFDSRLDAFQVLCSEYRMLIAAGIPTRGRRGTEISMLVFHPTQGRMIYSKQHLHADELPFFSSGTYPLVLEHASYILAPAICYESLLPIHVQQAADSGAKVYMASVAKSERGVEAAYSHYPKIAKMHSITVMMANCVGAADDFIGAGMSAIWASDGEIVCSTDSARDALVVYDTRTGEGKVLSMV